MNIVIPMAGLGSRFTNAGYTIPKPLIDIEGKPMIQQAVETLGFIGRYIFIIQKDEIIKKSIFDLIPNSINDFLLEMKEYRKTMPKGMERMKFLEKKAKDYISTWKEEK